MGRRASRALPPGPPLPASAQTLLIWRWPLRFLSASRARYGPRFTVNIASHPPLVFLSDPGEIGAVLAAPSDRLHPGEGARTIEPLVGERSFMLADGEQHLRGRRAVLPAFGARVVCKHRELIAELASRELALWARGTPLALHPRLRALTLDTLLRTIFAGSSDPGEGKLCELRDRLLRMLAITASAALPQPLLRHGPDRRAWSRFLADRASLDALIYSIIDRRRRAGEGPGDLLDRLLALRRGEPLAIASRHVRDDLVSILLAGHETTASELAWALQLLAHNPAVQERLIAQLDAGTGDRYLAATVQEVLRHRPVFLFAIPRAVKQPTEIGPVTYAPAAQLLACIYLLHHDPQLFPEPDEFRPERFLDGGCRGWLPWGGGRKRCPGLHLASLELETVIRTILATTTIQPAAGQIERPRWRSVIVTPHAGCRVVLRERRRRTSTAATPH